MTRTVFKVRDKGTGAFWNGDFRWSKFDAEGKSWRSKDAAEQKIGTMFRYNRNFNSLSFAGLRDKWEVVEIKVQEDEVQAHSINEFLEFCNVKDKLAKLDRSYAWFYEVMRKRGVHNDVQFIFKLKPADGERRVSRERTKEARAHLRQLGVKARTYREYSGMFGMMDREQAMRARLTLDVDGVIDLADIRAS